MDGNILLRRGKRRRRQCTATSLISCALILIATMQQQQQYAAAIQVGTSALEVATMTTTAKETDPEYANPAKYDEATQYYYRTRASDGNEHGAATSTATTLPTYANYFDVIGSKTGVTGSLITNHNLEEFRDATRTTEIEVEQGFMPTMLSPAGQHYAAAAAATAATANNIAQNGYPMLLASESFKLPAGSKIDYEINAGNYDDISSSSGSNRALNDRNEVATPGENIFQHLLQKQQQQQQEVQHPVQRQQQHSVQRHEQQQPIYNTFASTQVQQKQHAPYAPNELRNYYNAYSTTNAEEFPDFRSHYLSDYQMPQFSNYLKAHQQEQQMQAQHADYGKEMLLKTPAEATHFETQANYAVNADDKQQQQQSDHQKFVNYANQHEKRQQYSPQEQQQQTAEPSQLQLQVTDSTGHTITLPPSHSRRARGGDDIDINDIDSITTKNNNNIINDSNDLAPFQSYYYNQQQQQQYLQNKDQQHTDNNLLNMHQQLTQQRQQFAQLQFQLQQHDQLLQQQHQQQLQQQNLLSLTHEVHRPHIIAENKLPPVTNTVHHSSASAAAIAGIPLGKHVQITKHVPTLSHYQQHFVPFKQNVPIEIPRPVITTVPRPYPIRIPMTKTVAVPQLKEVKIPIERIKPFPVERNIPYLVERRVPYRVEKQVATPYYYPFPIKVPVVKTIVHRLPHHYQHHHQKHNGFGGLSSGNSIYDGGHIR